MDERRLKASDVCEALHVSEQTIHQWRSFGVPPRRIPHVDRYMLEWVDPANVQPGITDEALAAFVESKQNLVLHPTEDEFDAWNRAALAEREGERRPALARQDVHVAAPVLAPLVGRPPRALRHGDDAGHPCRVRNVDFTNNRMRNRGARERGAEAAGHALGSIVAAGCRAGRPRRK